LNKQIDPINFFVFIHYYHKKLWKILLAIAALNGFLRL